MLFVQHVANYKYIGYDLEYFEPQEFIVRVISYGWNQRPLN